MGNKKAFPMTIFYELTYYFKHNPMFLDHNWLLWRQLGCIFTGCKVEPSGTTVWGLAGKLWIVQSWDLPLRKTFSSFKNLILLARMAAFPMYSWQFCVLYALALPCVTSSIISLTMPQLSMSSLCKLLSSKTVWKLCDL